MGKKANAINKVAKAIDASADASSNSVKGALKSLIVACDSSAEPQGDSVPGLIEQIADVVPGGGGGGGGGSEHAISYLVLNPGGSEIEPESEFGTIKALPGVYDPDEEFIYASSSTPLEKAEAGTWVIVQTAPGTGYLRKDLTPPAFIDECGQVNVLPTQGSGSWYFFIMPDNDVTVRVQFQRSLG